MQGPKEFVNTHWLVMELALTMIGTFYGDMGFCGYIHGFTIGSSAKLITLFMRI